LGARFPHVRLNPNSPKGSNQPLPVPASGGSVNSNPFWKVWVNNLRIEGMLGPEKPEESMLSSAPLENSAAEIANYTGTYDADRQWVHDDFNLALALTNLRGIPTQITFNHGAQSFVEHADYIRFGIAATEAKQRVRNRKVYESKVLGPASQVREWEEFTQFILGTGAFPAGFPARELNRCITDYRCHPVVIPDQNQPNGCKVVRLPIDTDALAASGVPKRSEYSFLSVDAGVTNNAPVEIAHTYLSGFGSSNPRESAKADRAIVLIDPFAEQIQVNPAGPKAKSVFAVLLKMIFGTIEESRYHTRDLILAADTNVKSRLLVTAFRPDPRGAELPILVGGKAICSSRFNAFFGFFNEEYSKHDFFLGRYCCQEYLLNQNETWLPDNNPIFGNENPTGKLLPVIPLLGSVDPKTNPQTLPDWPSWSKFSPTALTDGLRKRLEVMLAAQVAALQQGLALGFWRGLGLRGLAGIIKCLALDWAVNAIVRQIEAAKTPKNDPTIPSL